MRAERSLTVLLGMWVALSVILGFDHTFNQWNNLIAGTVVAAFGFGAVRTTSWGPVATVLGMWLIGVAAFFPGLHSGGGFVWNNLVAGLTIAVCALAPTDGRGEREG